MHAGARLTEAPAARAAACALLLHLLIATAALAGGPSAGPGWVLARGPAGPELAVSWTEPTAAAAFVRAGRLWLLFAAEAGKPPPIPPEIAEALPGFRWLPHPRLTVFQMNLFDGAA